MKYLVKPSDQALGELQVPGDKSISHRAIMFGSIAQGCSQVTGFLNGEDCIATLRAFANMGVRIEQLAPTELKIEGTGKFGLSAPDTVLDLGNSGTSMRLLMGLLAGQKFNVQLVGDHSLMSRPMGRVREPLTKMGADINTAANGTPPVEIRNVSALNGIHYELPVASAQVKSAVLLAGLYAQGDTIVIEPQPTRDHTERMLQSFAYPIDISGNQISISGDHHLQATSVDVPADISSAAFFIVAACIARQGEITLHNVGVNPTRTGVLEILQKMNAEIDVHNCAMMGAEPVASITARSSALKGIDIPPELVPAAIDEFPAICIAAACADGNTQFTRAAELRVKESDRIAQMASGLRALGVAVEEFPDGLNITGGQISGGCIDSGGDHRVAMAFAIAALRAGADIEISDCANVATSFPSFVETAHSAGININVC